MKEKQICCSASEHCYCESLTVNDQAHVKCCNCGHQKSRAMVNAELVESTQRYAWGAGTARDHIGGIVPLHYEQPRTISVVTTWKDRYEAQ